MLEVTYKVLILALFVAINSAVGPNDCKNVGSLQTYYDPKCEPNLTGCNAGKQGLQCRFCGISPFPDCPVPGDLPENSEDTPPIINQFGERLIFSDEFDYFDFRTWKHDLTMSGGGNNEFQMYLNNRSNTFVTDGKLHIKATLLSDRIGQEGVTRDGSRMEIWGGSPVDQCTGNNFYGCERVAGYGNILNPIQSGKISTVSSFSFKYGTVEVRAKLPKGDWLWPAIWLLPATNSYGMWPASGEIDIMESRGNADYNDPSELEKKGAKGFGSALHWGMDYTRNKYTLTNKDYIHEKLLSEDFHVYGLRWTEDRLFTYIDDPKNIVMELDFKEKSFFERGEFEKSYENPWRFSPNKHAPFDQDFYLIINLAVGGTNGFFSDNVVGKPWKNEQGNAMRDFFESRDKWYPTWTDDFMIDYVRVWS